MTRTVVGLRNFSTGTTVTNTTAETVLHTFVIPATALNTGQAMRYSLAGTIVGADSTNPALSLRTRLSTSTSLGSLIMGATALTIGTSTSARTWTLTGNVVATSTAAQRHWTHIDVATAGAGVQATTMSLIGVGDSTKDFDGALRIQATAQMSAASTQFTIEADVGTFEWVRV